MHMHTRRRGQGGGALVGSVQAEVAGERAAVPTQLTVLGA